MYFDGLFWVLGALILLIILQNALHREIQTVLLLLTRRSAMMQAIFALIFLPGVFLHELSHFVMAKLLFVKTGRFSIIPRAQPNGTMRLGYVEAASGGFIRDALIGVAPLLTGCIFLAFVGISQFHLFPLWNLIRLPDWEGVWSGLLTIPTVPDFWLWFYLTFTVSSTMMPSVSDRHAWLPLGLFAGALIGGAILAGAGSWMMQNLASPFNTILRILAIIFGASVILHTILFLPFLLFDKLLSGLKRL